MADSGAAIVLNGAELTIADIESVALGRDGVRLDPGARRRVGEARAVIDRLVASGEVVYGVTTGFGSLASTFVPPERARELQERLLLSHAAGVGEPLPTSVVRAMLLLRANTLALGHSGCRPELIERLCEMLALGLHPVVPSQGSVGASGDLAPLAHLALPLIGHGTVELQGRLQPAAEALAALGLAPLVLEPKEGLALLNGTQMMTAIGALALAAAERLARTASVAAAMSTEALRGTEVAFSAAYQSTRPHPGQVRTAAELRWLLRDSELQRSHHADSHRVQDPYSLRCVPQVHGAVRDALAYLHGVLDIEMNSATDNPLVFPEGGHVPQDALATGHGLVISGGNFHGEPVALALDLAKLAIAELGAISERRVALLLDPRLNDGLPAFLGAASGLDSGLIDPAVHGGRPGLGIEGAGTSRLGRFDPHLGQPGGPRLDGLHRRAPPAPRPRALRAHPRHRAHLRRPGAGPPPRRSARHPAGPRCGGGALRVSAPPSARLEHDREPGPDLAAAGRIVQEGLLVDLAVPPDVPETSWLRLDAP